MHRNPLEQEGQIFDMELMNPNPTSSKTKDGPVYRVSFEVHRELWDMFMDTESKGMIIAAKGMVMGNETDFTPQVAKPKGEYSDEARMLVVGGFFMTPDVYKKIGTDEDYQAWCRLQKCIVCGDPGTKDMATGEVRNVYAHVRRAGEAGTAAKPEYRGVPMCDNCHHQQHQHGELFCYNKFLARRNKPEAKETWQGPDWFNRVAAAKLGDWARTTFVEQMGYESLTEVPPNMVIDWAEQEGVLYCVPQKYMTKVHGDA